MATPLSMDRPVDFHRIEIELAQMAGLVETNLAEAITAFERRDVTAIRAVENADTRINHHQQSIEMNVFRLLENHTLPSEQLREAMTVVKLAADLERVGDLAKNIARRTCIISREKSGAQISAGVARMGRASLRQFSDILNAYTARDLGAAKAVWAGDTELDELYYSVFREILLDMRENADHINSATHMVFIAKNFERVGDHATNIAEAMYFLLTGEPFTEESLKESNDILVAVDYGPEEA